MIYETTLVTFIDVLGFQEVVSKDKNGEFTLEIVKKLRSFGISDLFGIREANSAIAIQFSDSIVRCTPIPAMGKDSLVRSLILQEIEDITYIQGELACHSILIRGGIALGLASIYENGVFGPAFIDAYSLESKHALYPRVVLHPNLSKVYSKQGNAGWGIYADDELLLTRNSEDGFQYIDYFKNFPREIHTDSSNELEMIMRSYMEPRKKRIELEISKAPILSSIRTKYVWLANYHDVVVQELFGENAPDLLIGQVI